MKKRSNLSVVEACEPRRMMAAQTLNMTSSSESVVMWTDSSGYNRFGPSYGVTYYFDASGSNPSTTAGTSGTLYRFNSTYTSFTLNLGAGNDSFAVDSGATQGSIVFNLNGGLDQDTITGGQNNDSINGNESSDFLVGGSGNDSINGGDNTDTIDGSAGNDNIYGGSGGDQILGGKNDDTIRGESGNDDLRGNDGADSIDGGDGADTLQGGLGADTLFSGRSDNVAFSTSQQGDGDQDILAGNDTGLGDDGVLDDLYVNTSPDNDLYGE